MRIEVREESIDLGEYARIPITFEVTLVLDVSGNADEGFSATERHLERAPYVKDYDACPGGGPQEWPKRFNLTNWGFFTARIEGRIVGAAAVARNTPDLEVLEGRPDLAVLWDIRVRPEVRGRGVGSALFRAAETWASARGCFELKVETQTINVPACRFYARHGCVLKAVRPDAYPTLPHEVQLLWYRVLESARPGGSSLMLTAADEQFFTEEQARHEVAYLAGTNPRQQSGFGRNAHDWERFRRVVVAPIETDGSFLDIGCANGLLMESVVEWAREDGYVVEPYGLEISEKLANLARQRLPHWRDRIFVGNALAWDPPSRFDVVRTELVYVPPARRREFVERLLERHVAPSGRLLVCSYGSSRPEGPRAELLVDELLGFGLAIQRVDDAAHPEYGFVITRVVTVRNSQS
jgi:GNAT superfamily N-acetyltransferase